MAVALKFALIICSIVYTKKPSFMNENSVCYKFHGEPANDIENSWIVTSLWINRQEKLLQLGQESHVGLTLLLLLSVDIELYPGPCMKCFTCSKSIRKTQCQEKCFHCGKLFHLKCLADKIIYAIENIVCRACMAKERLVDEPLLVPLTLKDIPAECEWLDRKIRLCEFTSYGNKDEH